MNAWLTTDEAAAHLRICRVTLVGWLATGADAGIEPPCVDVSAPASKRRKLRWDATRLGAWFREVAAWQRDVGAVMGGKSSGGTRRAGSAGGSAQTHAPPTRSSSPSRARKPSGKTGRRSQWLEAAGLSST